MRLNHRRPLAGGATASRRNRKHELAAGWLLCETTVSLRLKPEQMLSESAGLQFCNIVGELADSLDNEPWREASRLSNAGRIK